MVLIFTYILRVSLTPADRLIRFAGTLGPETEEAAMTTAEQLEAREESAGRPGC